MATDRNEPLLSSKDNVDTSSLAPQETIVTKPEKTVRPKRKPTQRKAAPKPIEVSEPETIEKTKLTDSAEPLSEIGTAELETTPTEGAQTPAFQGKLHKKQRRETYTKAKIYIRNDLLERIKALTKIKDKGFKTSFVNYALEKSLNELEATEE